MLDNTFQFKTVDCSNIVIGIDSTLLYESFGRGSRTVFCDLRPKDKFLKKNRYFGWPKKFSTQGPFWTSKSDYISLRNLINRVTNYKNNQWRYFMKKFQKDLMPYDKNNMLFYNILNK